MHRAVTEPRKSADGSMVHSVGSAGKQKGNSEIQDANQTRAGLLRLPDGDLARVSAGEAGWQW